MKNRYQELKEEYLFEEQIKNKIKISQDDLMKKQSQERQDYFDKLNRYRKQLETENEKKVGLSEAVYNDLLGTAFKAIYITALGDISEQAEAIANKTVEDYITENGGARRIIRKNAGKTYLLDILFEFVNDAYDQEMDQFNYLEEASKKAEKDEKDAEKVGDTDDQNLDADAQQKAEAEVADKDADTTEEEPTAADDTATDDQAAQPENAEAPTDDQTAPAEEVPATDEEVPAEDDGTTDDIPAEEPVEDEEIPEQPDSKEELFKKMEQEDDVTAAVDLISQRIEDAEADFIKKNAQDKKKIEKIIDKLNVRINGATGKIDQTMDAAGQAPAATPDQTAADNSEVQAAQQEATRAITDVRENSRFHSIFEEMVKDNATGIVKNQALLESYTNDEGKLNMDSVIESTKVLYGFLEFVNTIQLETVNTDFVKNVLDNY